jgi:peptidyl-prolyl cis-trans isomerase B (cyclophilin B)
MVLIKTSLGDIKAEIWDDKTPETAKNFLRYVDEGFFSGTVFHRVINGFMIQGGGMTKDLVSKKPHGPIKNEASAELKNVRGTLAMARTSDIHSASCQFFINVVDNAFLDHTGEMPQQFGYCAFGNVVEGMDVVDKIKAVKTTVKNGMKDVPAETVEILSVTRVK